MQVFATPPAPQSNRSLSYNDLKKRRLQRSNSHKKITIPQQQSTQIKRRHLTEQKSIVKSVPKDEKVIEGVIDQLKGVLGDIRRNKSNKKFFSLRQSMTERPSAKQKVQKQKSQKKIDPLWNNIEQGTQTRQLIRSLLSKNKSQSQRRLMKFNQVRDKLKMQKEKSRSQQKSKIIKQIQSPFKTKSFKKNGVSEQTIEELINKKTSKPKIEQKQRQKISTLDRSLQELNNCPQDIKQEIWKKQMEGKQNKEIVNIMDLTQISEIRKNDEVQEISQSCALVLQKTHVDGSFLKLLDRPKQLQTKLIVRQVRRRCQMDRIRRIFPSGFFAS